MQCPAGEKEIKVIAEETGSSQSVDSKFKLNGRKTV